MICRYQKASVWRLASDRLLLKTLQMVTDHWPVYFSADDAMLAVGVDSIGDSPWVPKFGIRTFKTLESRAPVDKLY